MVDVLTRPITSYVHGQFVQVEENTTVTSAVNLLLSKNAKTVIVTSSPETINERGSIFKVIMTIQGLDHNSGDIVTIVSVNGDSRVTNYLMTPKHTSNLLTLVMVPAVL